MPTHNINTVDDAWRVMHRYGLQEILESEQHNPESFACWLYQRARKISTEEVTRYLRQYRDDHIASGHDGADFEARNVIDAEDAMSGYRHYEKLVSDLMWLVRRERTRRLGRQSWSTVAALAVARDKASVINNLQHEVLVEVRHILQALAQMRLEVHPIRYIAGIDSLTDSFMFADLERLDETLSVDSLWRDEEELIPPTEISMLAQLVEDTSVLPTLDAKLKGVLVMPSPAEDREGEELVQ